MDPLCVSLQALLGVPEDGTSSGGALSCVLLDVP